MVLLYQFPLSLVEATLRDVNSLRAHRAGQRHGWPSMVLDKALKYTGADPGS